MTVPNRPAAPEDGGDMVSVDPERELEDARGTILALQEELAETNRGLIALAMELEERVEERTAQLRAAHAELERTNSELLQLTLELEDRVEQRTQELQRKSEEVRAMSQQLWQTAKLATMGELAASVAHELNNPLATITLHVEALLEEADSDHTRQPLRVLEQEVNRMSRLVENLLQFSRRSQQRSTLDLRDELERTLDLVQYHLRNRSVDVVRHFVADVPAVHADRQQLRQVFLNLITNAADAMPGGGTLTIAAALGQLGRDEPAAVVIITDTGTGIDATALPRVFEPFFTTKVEGKGTGLGLAICRRIIEEHGGTIGLGSEVGKGTTVTVALPVAHAPTAREAGSTGPALAMGDEQ